jgi:hypothetical protein
MVESEVSSLRKVNGFYSQRIVDSLISVYVIGEFHNCIDSVVVGTKSSDEDPIAVYLGFYD